MVALRSVPARGSLGVRAAAAAFAAALLAAPAAAQPFLDAYRAGVEAAVAGDWALVESSMREAIAGRAEESPRLLRHLYRRPYLPHYHLGRALAERGECPAALEAFAESERQGVIQGFQEDHAVLGALRARCEERLAAEAAAREREAAVRALVGRAGGALDEVRRLAPDPAADPDLAEGWERGEPSLAARLAGAEADLEAARRKLDAAGVARELDAAADLARGILTRMAAVRREAELRAAAVAEERSGARARLEELRRPAEELLAATRELGRQAPAVGRRRAALEAALPESAEAGGTIAGLQEAARRLEREIARLRAASQPPPAALLEAADAWLRGEPEAVLSALGRGGGDDDGDPAGGGIDFPEPRARAHALLLRAAAAFALYHGGGGREPELLASARRDVLECRRADPAVAPIPRAFSPRFRAFFAEVADGGGPGAD